MSAYQDWAYARSCQPCRRDHYRACEGVAWDAEESRVIGCMCGCSGDEKNITRGDE